MATLNIKLSQKYKSFPQEFETTIEGDLIIISGVNGSGKSQLMEIINGQQKDNPNKVISATKDLNGIPIKNGDILYKSLMNSLNSGVNIGVASPQRFIEYKDQVWSNYHSYQLDENNQNLRNFQKSSGEAKRLLIQRFGEIKFHNNEIQRLEINDAIPPDFIWQSDDIFTNGISDLFYKYASSRQDLITSKSESGILANAIDFDSEIGLPPWKQLNELFSLLKIEYRFKEDYKLKNANIEQPKLYAIGSGGNLLEDENREVNDLSDGEKVIISLIFSSLSGISSDTTKVLLLDEFDATFNPSLTEMFYTVIKKYFTDVGIVVIIVTHSPTTISLAPEDSNFYEVFKSDQEKRILPVQKEQYNELQIANRGFYEKIGSQGTRIKELMEENKKLEDIKGASTIILVEDKYDQIYKISWLKLQKIQCTIDDFEVKFQENSDFSIFGGYAAGGIAGFLRSKNLTMLNGKNIIGVFDFDKEGTENFCSLKKEGYWEDEPYGDKHTGIHRKRTDQSNCHAVLLPIPSNLEHLADIDHPNYSNFIEIENLLPEKFLKEEHLVTEKKVIGSTYLKVKDDKKKDLWKLLFSLGEADFENFRPLFEKIKSICSSTEKSSS